jgi:hypothetical protein
MLSIVSLLIMLFCPVLVLVVWAVNFRHGGAARLPSLSVAVAHSLHLHHQRVLLLQQLQHRLTLLLQAPSPTSTLLFGTKPP